MISSPQLKKILFLSLALVTLHPSVSAAVALLTGIVAALSLGNPFPDKARKFTPILLQISVVGLGAGMNLKVISETGLHGIGYTALTIVLTMIMGLWLGNLVKVSQDASLLITVGTAICGGSAIAAVAASIRAKHEDISIALATVFFLNAMALFIFPWIGHGAGLDQTQFGLWSALAVHDTSSVVGTSLQYGPLALQVGTTVKLARALWIVPLTLMIGFIRQTSGNKQKIKWPWFILGFLIAAALVTWIPAMEPVGRITAEGARRLLVLTLFLIGSNLTRSTLKAVGFRPFAHGFLLWIIVASGTMAAISGSWIHL